MPPPGSGRVAGLAAGLAAGTKLSFLAPVIALWLGLIVIAGRGRRVRTALWFGLPAFLTSGYWFVRNLVAVGNPIPYTNFGPLGLPAPERAFELRPGYSVFHYWDDPEVWREWFVPGLHESFGVLWPLVIAAFVGAGVYALWRGGDPLLRVLGAMILFTAVAYVFTPLTAAGEQGAADRVRVERPVRGARGRGRPGAAPVPAGAAAHRARAHDHLRRARAAVPDQRGLARPVAAGPREGGDRGGGRGARRLRRDRVAARPRPLGPARPLAWVAGLLAVVTLGALGAGWWEQRHYLERRYENLSPDLKLADAVRWARDLRDAKIALAGVRGVFNQYPFYGTDLSNRVQWLGRKGPDGAYERIPTCAEWRQALADGGYTHVVTTYDPFDPGAVTNTKEGLWMRSDPGAKQLLRDGPVSVFRIDQPPDPAGCAGLPNLSQSELDGDSVNADPTANQPSARYETDGSG